MDPEVTLIVSETKALSHPRESVLSIPLVLPFRFKSNGLINVVLPATTEKVAGHAISGEKLILSIKLPTELFPEATETETKANLVEVSDAPTVYLPS
jgi:hypothetical protein